MTEEASPALADVLREEVKYEEENYKQPEEVKSVPEPWTLKDEPGSTHVMLERKFDNEKVVVDLLIHEQDDQNEELNEQEGEDGEVDVDVDVSVSFSVSIVKNGRALVFDCTSDGSYVEIVHVSLADETALNTEQDDEAYEGPVYQELDEKLQQAFEEMLAERGVTPELGEYLMRLSEDKEQREYMGWLQRVADVVN
ncbi:hypothetical protein WJX81_003481 [Elliptochloris bilobata]|uniref:Uncharacterized protein n=1 Tax=Elliptochloris bilobata TaxID=381761 RepID=A0AAW1S0R1_9CHLO